MNVEQETQYVSIKGILPNSYALWMALFAVSFIIFLYAPVFKLGSGPFGLIVPGGAFTGWIGYGLFAMALIGIGSVIIPQARPYCKIAKIAFLACLVITLLFLIFNIGDILNQARQMGLPRAPFDLIGYGVFFLPLWLVFALLALLSNPAKSLGTKQ